jgi:hypothetical protein
MTNEAQYQFTLFIIPFHEFFHMLCVGFEHKKDKYEVQAKFILFIVLNNVFSAGFVLIWKEKINDICKNNF